MDNSLLDVRDINHKYIVVERNCFGGSFSVWGDRTCTAGKLAERENPSGNDRAGDTI